MRAHLSPTLRSRYDYYYSTLSPASSAANFYDNQNLSLFGDPVPPATDFLETLDNHLYGRSLRRSSFGEQVAPPPPPPMNPAGGQHLHGAASYVQLPSISSSASAQSQQQQQRMYHPAYRPPSTATGGRHKPPAPQPPPPHMRQHFPPPHQYQHQPAPPPPPQQYPMHFGSPTPAYNVLDERLPTARTTNHHHHLPYHYAQQQHPPQHPPNRFGRPPSRGADGRAAAQHSTTTSSGGESSSGGGGQRRRPSGMSQQSAVVAASSSSASTATMAMMTTFGTTGRVQQQQHHQQHQHRRSGIVGSGGGGYEKEVDVNLDFRISNEVHLPPVPPPKRISCTSTSDPHDPYTNHNRTQQPPPPTRPFEHQLSTTSNASSSNTSASCLTQLTVGAEPTLKTFSPNNWIPQHHGGGGGGSASHSATTTSGRPLPPTPAPKPHHNRPAHRVHSTKIDVAADATAVDWLPNRHDAGRRSALADSSDSGVAGGGGGDAMTAIIADSSTNATATSESVESSSGDDATRLTPPPPSKSTRPASHQPPQHRQQHQQQSDSASTTIRTSIDIEPYQVLPYDERKMNPNPSSTLASATTTTSTGNGSVEVGMSSRNVAGGPGDSDSTVIVGRVTMKEMSPTVLTDTITTGGYRINQPRPHKKSSFAIINEFKIGPSRAPSPSSSTGRTSPFRGKGFRPTSRSVSPTAQQMLGIDVLDDIDPIARPGGIVHFDQRTGRRATDDSTATTMTTTTTTTTPNGDMESYEIRTDLSRHKTLIQISHGEGATGAGATSRRSSVGPSPAPRRRFYASTGDLTGIGAADSFGDRPPVNPRSTQRGLLRIVAPGDPLGSTGAISKIPRRKSITASQEHLMQTRFQAGVLPSQLPSQSRRSSISPGRRGSQSTGPSAGRPHKTHYHHASIPQPTQHAAIDLGIMAGGAAGSGSKGKQNVARSSSRISRPTPLSPIAGTPNKDSEQEDAAGAGEKPRSQPHSGLAVDVNVTMSPTKIPVSLSRRNSGATGIAGGLTVTSRNVSRAGSTSRENSREPSPASATTSSGLRPPSKPVSRSGSNRSASGAVAAKTKPAPKPAVPSRTPAKKDAPPPPNYLKKPTSLKRDPSASKLARSSSNLRREKSTVTPADSLSAAAAKLKRENSSLSKSAKDTPKRQTSKLALPTAQLHKNKSDSNLNRRLEKQGSFRSVKGIESSSDSGAAGDSSKLVPLTKPNVVSMTTAAITAQPLAITTAVSNTTTTSGGESDAEAAAAAAAVGTADPSATLAAESAATAAAADPPSASPLQAPAVILEHSQKALECIQKTMLEASDEIQRTIEGNLNDLQSLATDLRTGVEPGTTGRPPPPAMLEKKTSTRSLVRNASGAALSGVPEAADEAHGIEANVVVHAPMEGGGAAMAAAVGGLEAVGGGVGAADAGGAMDGAGKAAGKSETDSQKSGDSAEQSKAAASRCSKCCAPCFGFLCLPCRRLGACCRRSKPAEDAIEPTAEAKGAVGTAAEAKQKLKSGWCSCCRRSRRDSDVEPIEVAAAAAGMPPPPSAAKEPGKCALCLSKFLCCRRTNKVVQEEAAAAQVGTVRDADASPERRKCCWCIPCGRKKKAAQAWPARRESILSEPTEKRGCCARLFCCCRRRELSESRRASMNSKKQSIAPTIPPEDTRPKLDEQLIEHASMMKGAIPVLPLCLAWFCLICNVIVPGLGTILSGLFCLCIGVPRFSQHDGPKPRLGSFVINCIVGVSQMFCLLFCLVGWGWSIWWGTIMLRLARKKRQLKQDAIDAEMQQEEQTTSSNRTVMPPMPRRPSSARDVEAGVSSGAEESSAAEAASPVAPAAAK